MIDLCSDDDETSKSNERPKAEASDSEDEINDEGLDPDNIVTVKHHMLVREYVQTIIRERDELCGKAYEKMDNEKNKCRVLDCNLKVQYQSLCHLHIRTANERLESFQTTAVSASLILNEKVPKSTARRNGRRRKHKRPHK
jgi:hypothetical protein